ncbi:hypothetical protein Pcinc_014466 [Petrolisthes cinctipes]|uniref:Uncharacterized protein n=1 Tax=Petrolisthes cinctipes TaxID=88211 RepID=A0AAE1FV02_PETCI|nr:hypothetical protein Pcinc_014466 [Petrolisthes cinctipes]
MAFMVKVEDTIIKSRVTLSGVVVWRHLIVPTSVLKESRTPIHPRPAHQSLGIREELVLLLSHPQSLTILVTKPCSE